MTHHVFATDKAANTTYHVDACRDRQESGEVARYVRERTDAERWTVWTSGWHNGEPAWDRKAHLKEPNNATGGMAEATP